MKVSQVIQVTANRFPEKSAIYFRDGVITFKELADRSSCLAAGLSKLGVKKGDKVALLLPNWPEYIYSYLAVFMLGAVAVPLDFMLKQDELKSCLEHCEAKVLIAKSPESVALENLQEALPRLEKIILCHEQRAGFISFEDLIKNSALPPKVEISDSDPALIMYTSGTTGRPKGILLNYRHLDGSPEAMKYFVDLTGKDVKISALPLSHIAGLIYIQNCILFGISLVLMERFVPVEFLKNIQQFKVTCFHVVPSMYMALLQVKEMDKFDLSSLRWIVDFGAPSSPEILSA